MLLDSFKNSTSTGLSIFFQLRFGAGTTGSIVRIDEFLIAKLVYDMLTWVGA
jgi:hypothetical protein